MPASGQGSDQPARRGRDPAIHRYDSFVLRLWMRGDPATFHRAEMRRVQSETIATATNVTLDWVQDELVRMLGQDERGDSCRTLAGDV